MGIKVINLALGMAEIVEYPAPTAAVIARFGRDAALLTTGARGRHVPDATALDAARLLLAMMLTQSPARAVAFMRDFGDLMPISAMRHHGEDFPEIVAQLFPHDQTFAEAIAAILAGFGSREFADKITPAARKWGHNPDDQTTMFPIDIVVRPSDFEAEIQFGDATIVYAFRSLKDVHVREAGETSSVVRDAVKAADAAGKPYERAIKSEFSVQIDVLQRIGDLLSGADFTQHLDQARLAQASREVSDV